MSTSEFLLRNYFGGKVPANRRHCRCSMRYDVHLSFLQQSEFFLHTLTRVPLKVWKYHDIYKIWGYLEIFMAFRTSHAWVFSVISVLIINYLLGSWASFQQINLQVWKSQTFLKIFGKNILTIPAEIYSKAYYYFFLFDHQLLLKNR